MDCNHHKHQEGDHNQLAEVVHNQMEEEVHNQLEEQVHIHLAVGLLDIIHQVLVKKNKNLTGS